MKTRATGPLRAAAAAVAALCAAQAQAFTWDGEDLKGSFDSTVTVGTGIRTGSPDCSLIVTGATGPGAPAGCLAATAGLGDQGDLNYAKGNAFTTYVKGSHELLLKFPEEQITFMARGNWLYDATATHTTGDLSALNPPGQTSGLSTDEARELRSKLRLLDFWVSKTFDIGDEQLRVRVGNQVISWGESLFLPGGINSTNAMDYMRLSQPGTQLKEVVLPAPMVSVASGLGHGFNIEAYVQAHWNADYFPPVGSYWSTSSALGVGGLTNNKPKNSGQWGLALRYQPEGTQLNLGLYALQYHDKSPNLYIDPTNQGNLALDYLSNRKLYGVSANFPVGDWALGTELSYRPHDAVSLNANTDGCAANNGDCWVDNQRYQWHGTALFSLTPSSAGKLLDLLHADTGTLLAEAVVIRYPGLKPSYNGELVSSGIYGWGQETNAAGTAVPMGSVNSSGYNFDFSWVYDGTVIPGWQMVPEVYYYQATSGRTPNAMAEFMKGAKSANYIISFLQNPTKWQLALNYTHFWGGSSVFDQPLRDRDFVGFYLSRNF